MHADRRHRSRRRRAGVPAPRRRPGAQGPPGWSCARSSRGSRRAETNSAKGWREPIRPARSERGRYRRCRCRAAAPPARRRAGQRVFRRAPRDGARRACPAPRHLRPGLSYTCRARPTPARSKPARHRPWTRLPARHRSRRAGAARPTSDEEDPSRPSRSARAADGATIKEGSYLVGTGGRARARSSAASRVPVADQDRQGRRGDHRQGAPRSSAG